MIYYCCPYFYNRYAYRRVYTVEEVQAYIGVPVILTFYAGDRYFVERGVITAVDPVKQKISFSHERPGVFSSIGISYIEEITPMIGPGGFGMGPGGFGGGPGGFGGGGGGFGAGGGGFGF